MNKKARPERGNTEVAKNIDKLWDREEASTGDKVHLTALAGSIGIAQSMLHRIYTGEILDPKDKTLKPIAEYFDVSISELRGHTSLKEGNTTSAKARLLARKIDTLPPRAQKALTELVEVFLSSLSHRKTG